MYINFMVQHIYFALDVARKQGPVLPNLCVESDCLRVNRAINGVDVHNSYLSLVVDEIELLLASLFFFLYLFSPYL